ncbi:HlyD family efflux transporter periplasmic adaptor subunit [Clostridioides difficile]|uniref:HlyD family efflux transporter periplasmic adaptor subunit n=1 Tax=Clostridioides sp. GD02404 TaxID=3054354 RepID=UPI0032FF934B
MKKIKYTRLMILGILIYLVFNVLVMIISKNIDTLVLKVEKFDAKIHVEGNIEKDANDQSNYLSAYISKEDSKNFEKNQNVAIEYRGQKIDAKVYKIYKNNNKIMLKLKISNQIVSNQDTSVEEFDIIYNQMECLKIPKTSIKTKDNKRGVYVIDEQSQSVKFVILEGITYENESSVFVDYYKNDINGVTSVNLYDKIILRPNCINTNIRIK